MACSTSSSCSRMSTAMALVASSRRPKRRSLSEFITSAPPLRSSPTKRRRSNRCRRLPTHLAPPPPPPLFVKTEPLQNLSATQPHVADDHGSSYDDLLNFDLSDEYSSPRLQFHRVPSFFSSDHPLIDVGYNKNDDCGTIIPAMAAAPKIECYSASPISPLMSNSDSGICSGSISPLAAGTEDDSPAAMYQRPAPIALPLWEDGDEDDQASCDFLSHDFYEMQTEMRSIIGEGGHDLAAASPAVSHLCEMELAPDDSSDQRQGCMKEKRSGRASSAHDSSSVDRMSCWESELSMEETSKESDQSGVSHQSSSSSSTLLLQMQQETEEEYSIDLTDFEMPENSGSELTDLLIQKAPAATTSSSSSSSDGAGSSETKKRMFFCLKLDLNYEQVATEWSDRGSVMTDGSWPSPESAMLDLDLSAWEAAADLGSAAGAAAKMIKLEGGGGADVAAAAQQQQQQRLASVLRYREKRRTRLFAKKIRYEVRKLNAERRPRMKGRFIKRSAVE